MGGLWLSRSSFGSVQVARHVTPGEASVTESYLERARAILAAEAAAILAVDLQASFDEAVEAMSTCAGKIITTGMGKAGFVARKFAATLCSTGTPAVFVQPGEAAHGDLGVISRGDCIIAFSTSGKTREVLEVLTLARHLDCGKVVGITSHETSALRPE